MSRGTISLDQVAETLVSKLKVKSEEVRKKTYNKESHALSVSFNDIIAQIQEQIGIRLFTKHKVSIEQIVRTFTSKVFDKAIKARNSFLARPASSLKSGFAVQVLSLNRISTTSNNSEFRILIISLSGRGDAFNKAKALKYQEEDTMVKEIQKLTGKKVSFDIGHTEAVSSMQVQDAALDFVNTIKRNKLSIPYSVRKATSYKSIVKISIAAQKKRQKDRAYLVKIGETIPGMQEVVKKLTAEGKDPLLIAAILEDSEANQAKGRSTEQKTKNSYIRTAKELATKINFTNVRSSPTYMEEIIDDILLTAQKGGAIIKGRKPRKSSGPTRSKPVEKQFEKNNIVSASTKSSSSAIDISIGRENTSNAPTNWNSLLPLINTRLTPKVIANMRYPSLVNRTGTFAESAEVTRIETTQKGFPSFVFNYERDPYEVFDRALGRSPWNTPERDPKTLVDKSLREVLREMAISRFYTRRA